MSCACCLDPCACNAVSSEFPKKVIADYFMYVGTTGIVFVTGLPATQFANLVNVFDPTHERIAQWHAASDLADMGIIDGQTFRFMREAIPWSVAETAAFIGVPDSTVNLWESNVQTISRDIWIAMAQQVRERAQDYGPSGPLAFNPPDLRPRTIRIFTPVSGYPY